MVEGHPAIAVALPLLTTVTLREQAGPSTLQATIHDDRLWPALLTVLPAAGLHVHIASALPVGCGLGSSAALAVATLRALNAREVADSGSEGAPRAPADFAELHRRAFAIERAFHGTPSGIDHAVSLLGGAVRYRRTDSAPEITKLNLAHPLTLVVVNTGKPAFTTAEMVASVRARGSAAELRASLLIDPDQPDKVIEVWNKIDQLSPEAREQAMNRAENATTLLKPIAVSALTGEGTDLLLALIESKLSADRGLYQLILTPQDGAILAWIYREGEVLERRDEDNGEISLHVRLPLEKEGLLLRRVPEAKKLSSNKPKTIIEPPSWQP